MPTLHVRNVPEGLYEALRHRAEAQGTSIGAEAIALLQRALRTDLAGVREVLEEYERYRPTAKPGAPSAAELVREDRQRR
jgi:plasmid stability protein